MPGTCGQAVVLFKVLRGVGAEPNLRLIIGRPAVSQLTASLSIIGRVRPRQGDERGGVKVWGQVMSLIFQTLIKIKSEECNLVQL